MVRLCMQGRTERCQGTQTQELPHCHGMSRLVDQEYNANSRRVAASMNAGSGGTQHRVSEHQLLRGWQQNQRKSTQPAWSFIDHKIRGMDVLKLL